MMPPRSAGSFSPTLALLSLGCMVVFFSAFTLLTGHAPSAAASTENGGRTALKSAISTDSPSSFCEGQLGRMVERWRKKTCARRNHVKERGYAVPHNSKTFFDPWEPEWNCEMEDRVGGFWGDGGKFVCGMEYLATVEDCLVYSVGSHEQDDFERDVLARAPNCEVHTFDPTSRLDVMENKAAAGGYHFHQIGLSNNAQKGEKMMYGTLMPLSDIMKQLGHEGRRITIFKVDCEGCEWTVFPEVFERCGTVDEIGLDQLQVEVHAKRSGSNNHRAVQQFFEGADKCGMLLFHKERNHWGCSGYKCLEYAFVHQSWAVESFRRSHCPFVGAQLLGESQYFEKLLEIC